MTAFNSVGGFVKLINNLSKKKKKNVSVDNGDKGTGAWSSFSSSSIHPSHSQSKSTMSSAKNIEEAQRKGDFAIKPEAATPTLNTADWPLLLKVRTLPTD